MTARRFRTGARFAGAAAALFAVPIGFPAERSDFILIWNAPAECPAGEQVREAINKHLGVRQRGLVLRATATVTREPEAFRVELHTYDNRQRGVRELEAPTCEALVEAVALIVALAVDPALLGMGEDSNETPDQTDPQRSPPPDPNSEEASIAPGAAEVQAQSEEATGLPTVDDSTAAASRSTIARSSVAPITPAPLNRSDQSEEFGEASTPAFRDLGLQGVASLAGSLESGLLPGLGFGVTARGGIRLRRMRLEAAFSRWLERTSRSAQGPGTRAEGLSIAGWGCFRAVPAHTAPVADLRSELPPDDAPAIEASPCLGFEAGRLDVESFGVTDPGRATATYLATGGALRLGATAADWLSLDVRFEALRVVHRPGFEVESIGVVFQPRSWSLRAALGAEAYFP